MIRLGVRFAASGGSESVVRLVLTALGVAIGTTLLLLSAAVDPAIRAQQQRQAWQHSGPDQADPEGHRSPLLWRLDHDAVDGRDLTVLRVAAAGADAPVPLGLPHVPRPGEVFVSPPLERLLDDLPADRLAARFPAAPSGSIDRSYLAGPDDLVAVVGMEPAALRGQPWVHEVHRISTRPTMFEFTDALRLVVGIVAIGLLMPVLVFVATSTRLGAAQREQRLAALRLAGATPRQTRIVSAVEAGAVAAVGALLGGAAFVVLRPQVARLEIDGQRSFVDDVQVAPGLLAVILLTISALAVVASMASLRRLQISPLGVARRAVRARPTGRRLVPLAVGAVGFAVCFAMATGADGAGMVLPVIATFALMIYGIVVAGPWLTLLTARAITRISRHPNALLAGRRLEDDPASGFRAVSGLVLAVFVATVFSGVIPAMLAEVREQGGGLGEGTTMAALLPVGTSAAAADAAIDAAASSGAGPGILLHENPGARRSADDRRSVDLVACTGRDLLDLLGATGACPLGGSAWFDRGSDDRMLEPAPYAAAEVADMPVKAVAIATDGTAATTDRVRTAIGKAVPGAVAFVGSEAGDPEDPRDGQAGRRLAQMNRIANLVLVIPLVVAGCGLAVAVAAGIIERKRPFTLLRLAGMQLRELQRVAMIEAIAPLVLIALASAALGLGVSALIVSYSSMSWVPPTIGYWVSLAGGLTVAIGLASASLPLLGPTTAPSATRVE